MEPHHVRVFDTPRDFRAWIDKYHDTLSEMWVAFYKNGVPKSSMSYREAVEEALCYGWIDGITKRIDGEMYTIRFTPRRGTSRCHCLGLLAIADAVVSTHRHVLGDVRQPGGDAEATLRGVDGRLCSRPPDQADAPRSRRR